MATYNPRRFTNPKTLKTIDPTLLVKLLSRYDDYFSNRDLELKVPLDYELLAGILASPTVDTPEELSDALYFIHEMATNSGSAALIDELSTTDIHIDTEVDLSAADLAIHVYLEDPRLLETIHAEMTLTRRRSFEHFRASADAPNFKAPTKSILIRLEQELSNHFKDRLRGPFARVSVVSREDETWFFVRHGKTFQRQGSLEGQESHTIYFRPEQYDTVVYNHARNELRINSESQWINLYRQGFSQHLFNDPDYFNDKSKFTLEPLRQDGDLSLACGDIEGISSVKLKEISYLWSGSDPETEIRRAKDIFANLQARNKKIPPRVKIQEAKFLVTFSRFKRDRTVSIRPPNTAQYIRDEDGPVVEEWFRKRGFTR